MKTIMATNTCDLILVDDEDYDRINSFGWQVTGCYKKTLSRGITPDKRIAIANEILQNYDLMYDHKDRNFLNNLKENLRPCTTSQNAFNRDKFIKNSTSKHKGVGWHLYSKRWRARIVVRRKEIHLGNFYLETDAAKAYNEAALKYFGEFAVLNIV